MTANDSDVSDGETLTGSQVVRVYGQNLTAPFVTLTFGEVEYTPLNRGEGYIEFILGDNGTATISVDDSPFMSFEVEGVVVPEQLPTTVRMSQVTNTLGQGINVESVYGNCINYPFTYNEERPIFLLRIGSDERPFGDVDTSDFSGENCNVLRRSASTSTTSVLSCDVNDFTKPAWVMYHGFIIAVFNYTTD